MWNLLTKSKDILGMNARNLRYIRVHNLQSAKRLADDKLHSKRVLRKAGLPVPRLIGKIRDQAEFSDFDFGSLPNSFVLKPNFGFGGEGILVVYGRKKNMDNVWVKADRSPVTEQDLRNQVRNTLDGSFSRTGTPDMAFFEERILLTKEFKPYAYKGIPDIRVIVYNRVPIMAMLRIPTEASGGTSNLHQGGLGVGIDMATGVTTTAVQYNREIEYVPGKRMLLRGIKIPYWKSILDMAVKAQDVSRVGFLGADVAIDRERGPVFMELNARPGLSIQIANQEGMLRRLNRIEGLKINTTKRGVTLAQNLFGGEIEEEIEEISGKRIIKTEEKVKLKGWRGKEVEVEAKIDTGAGWSSIGADLAEKLGYGNVLQEFNERLAEHDDILSVEKKKRWKMFNNIKNLAGTVIIHSSHGSSYRPMVNVKIKMDDFIIVAKVTIIDRSHLEYPIIIGRRNLSRFFVEVK